MKETVLCSISTRGRYETTLPLAIQSVICQTRKVDKLIVFDDNDNPIDVRNLQVYQYLFQMLSLTGIDWEWQFAEKKGQHFNHQKANNMGYTWVWRMDDDTVAEPDVLENLLKYAVLDVGAVGGSVLTPPLFEFQQEPTGKIENIYNEPNIQWNYISKSKEVDHLHCSFIYRAGIADYNLQLSRVAHREETLFTYALKKKGYRILVAPAVTWHLKNNEGGIRSSDSKQKMFEHDEEIFKKTLDFKDSTLVILDCGMGDHIVFSEVLKDIENPIVFSCYHEIVPGRSIAEARTIFGDECENHNIYRKMDEWKWTDSLENAYRKLYVKGYK